MSNTNTTINFGKELTIEQAVRLTLAVPENIMCWIGEPGIGKSSAMGIFEETLGDAYNYAYIDCANLDLGDVAIPVPDVKTGTTRYLPNSRFRLTEGKPVVIMLDEYGKAMKPVQNMLHPMFEVRNPRLGDMSLPEGSIVFITGNHASDGVGDSLLGHTLGRITRIYIGKFIEDWLHWAANNDIDGAVMGWVHQYPHCFSSYRDGGQDDNLYIYNPRKMQQAYVSPRSLARASNIIKRRDKFDTDTLIAALSGTIGEAAARDMQAFIEFQDQLPRREQIIKDPMGVKVPKDPGACSVLVYNMIQSVDKESINPYMDFMERMEAEWQSTFCISIAKSTNKQSVAFSSKKFAVWVSRNEDIL
jgi:hypothetical protein